MRYFLSLMMGLLVCLFVFGQAEAELVGYWKFDGDTQDSSGKGNHGGTLVSDQVVDLTGDTAPTFVDGISGQALQFDGADDEVTMHYNTPTLCPQEAVTIEAWVNFSSSPGSNNVSIYHNNVYTSGSLYWLYHRYSGELTLDLENSEGTFGTIRSSWTPDLNEWCHVVGTYDSQDETFRLYLNGVEVANDYKSGFGTLGGPIANWTNVPHIGSYRSAYFFHGKIDEVRVYSHALTPGEIQQHYVKGLATKAVKEAVANSLLAATDLDVLEEDINKVIADIEGLYVLIDENADAIAELDGALDALAKPGASGIAKYKRSQ